MPEHAKDDTYYVGAIDEGTSSARFLVRSYFPSTPFAPSRGITYFYVFIFLLSLGVRCAKEESHNLASDRDKAEVSAGRMGGTGSERDTGSRVGMHQNVDAEVARFGHRQVKIESRRDYQPARDYTRLG